MTVEEIKKTASGLLSSGKVSMVIGYARGENEYIHALFATKPEEIEKMIYDESCVRNIAVYLNKPEIKSAGRVAIVAGMDVMRTVVMLAAEKQLEGEPPVTIGITDSGEVKVFETIEELSGFMKDNPLQLTDEEKQKLAELREMPRDQRWEYWKREFETCIKCYACRASCPLCYCTRCKVEKNQPQWVQVPAHITGNIEWHIMRAMHLAGRCINCGECRRSCPMDIPLNMLTKQLILDIEENFGSTPGMSHEDPSVLSTYKPEDKENFIR